MQAIYVLEYVIKGPDCTNFRIPTMLNATLSEHTHASSKNCRNRRLWFVALFVVVIALDLTLEKVFGRTRGSLLSPLQIPDLHLIFICISGLLAVFTIGSAFVRWWPLRRTLVRDCGMVPGFEWGTFCWALVVLLLLIDLFRPTALYITTATWPLCVGLLVLAGVMFCEPLLHRLQVFHEGLWIVNRLIRWDDIQSWCWLDQSTLSLNFRRDRSGETEFCRFRVGTHDRLTIQEFLQQYRPDRQVTGPRE
jgi:hypothetical protein